MAQQPTLLRALATQRHWQMYRTFLLHFERAAAKLAEDENDRSLLSVTVSKRQFERWYGGDVKTRPHPDLCRVLEEMFGHPIDTLLGPAGAVTSCEDQHSRLGMVPTSTVGGVTDAESRGGELTGGLSVSEDLADDTMERQVTMAARRAFRFSAMAEGSSVGAETLDQLQADVRRLTASYPRLPLSALLGDMIELQDMSFRLLERDHVRPNHARDLYLLSAITSGMLAKASHDMGDPRAAMMQARTAYVCADNADHHAVRAWVRGVQSLIAFWAGQPEDSAEYAHLGRVQGETATGTSRVWLSCLYARARAALGDAEAVRAAVIDAEGAREGAVPDDIDEFGGIMTFPLPRQLYYTADASAWLSDAPGLEDQAQAAVTAYHQAEPDEWAFGDQAGSHADLALGRVRSGTLDGVEEALRPVLDLPAEQRIHGIVSSVQQVHAALRQPRWTNAPIARQLRQEIEAFTANPVAALRR